MIRTWRCVPGFTSSAFSSSTGPPGCTGHPRWTQRFERIVKLGTPSLTPLFRTNAVRRETSPASGSVKNVAIMNWPSGKFSSGPRSAGSSSWPTNAGAIMKPSAGIVTIAPISAPIPSVDASRKRLRGKRSISSSDMTGNAGPPSVAGGAGPGAPFRRAARGSGSATTSSR